MRFHSRSCFLSGGRRFSVIRFIAKNFLIRSDIFHYPLQSLRLRCYDKKVPASGAAAARNPRPFRKQDLCKRKEVSDDTL